MKYVKVYDKNWACINIPEDVGMPEEEFYKITIEEMRNIFCMDGPEILEVCNNTFLTLKRLWWIYGHLDIPIEEIPSYHNEMDEDLNILHSFKMHKIDGTYIILEII